MAWPVFMPPPASRAQLTCGQWSRPASLLMRGVRPNSPQTTTVTSFEHAAHFQIVDQGGEALVELGAVVAHQVEVLAVAVPAAVGQRDAADAGLDQPAGHQQLIVDRRRAVVLELVRLAVAVALADLVALLASGRGRRRSLLEVSTPRARSVRASHALERAARVDLAAQAVEAGQQLLAVAELFERDALERQVGHALAVRLERRRRTVPRKPGVPESDHGMCCVGSARPTNGGTEGSTGPCSLASDGADARPAAHRGQRVRRPAGHALDGVVAAAGADDGADDGALVHAGGDPREDFADLDAGDVGGDRLELAADLDGGVRS